MKQMLNQPHFATEEGGMVSLVLPGLREAVAKVEQKLLKKQAAQSDSDS